jgi:two-component system, LytTR family, response regulator
MTPARDPEIRALIVDDEPLARRGIRQLLSREPDVTIVGECGNGRDALRALETLAPTLVFLDVQMPQVDGFGVIRERGPRRMPAVVFVTAHDEFAVKAFEAQAIDYLVKPLNAARFAETMARVRERHRLGAALQIASRLNTVLSMVGRESDPAPVDAAAQGPVSGRDAGFVVSTPKGELVVDAAVVDWIESQDYYVRLHVGPAQHLLRESLTSLQRRLDPRQFARVHRGAIVRLDRVREIRSAKRGMAEVVLRDGTRIPVGRRRYAQLRFILRQASRWG